ncbi:MAG: diguanylate cyclase, partial [Candidatus Bipolaricaulota bacterium]
YWVSTTKAPRYDRSGDLVGTLGISRDITARKNQEVKLESVQALAREIKLTNTRRELYKLVLANIKKIFPYDAFAVCEKDGDDLKIAEITGSYLEKSRERKMYIDSKGLIPAACREKESLYVPNVLDDERYVQGCENPGSEYVAPIEIEGNLYGAIDVEDEDKNAISESDRRLLDILADHVAVTLQGIDRLTFASKEQDKLKELHSAVDRLQHQTTQDEVLQTSVEVAEKILDFDLCAASLLEGDYLVPKASSSQINTGEIRKFRVGEGITGMTFEKGKTLWGGDISRYPGAKPTNPKFRSFISLPIGDIGNFQVVSKKVDVFTRQDVELAEILISHVTEELRRVNLEKELRHQAIHDPLTGVANRRYFNEVINKEVERGRRYGHPISFVILDVDSFKEINDNYSHIIGDKVLQEIANLLRENVRDADTLVRYGGDEFLIMMPETEEVVDEMVNRIDRCLRRWNEENDIIDRNISVSVGTSSWKPGQDQTIENALSNADLEMYENKNMW